jgi:hypothetical protein
MIEEPVSHYRIVKKLGAGGMGEVYLAEDTRLDRRVAVKLLGEEFNRDEARLRRFIREAKAASALNHPNILTVYDVGETESGTHFIATEYIEGETLRHHIQHSRMKIREVLDATVQVSSALSAAHQASIIHRDIKPENIMLRPDGYVKIPDSRWPTPGLPIVTYWPRITPEPGRAKRFLLRGPTRPARLNSTGRSPRRMRRSGTLNHSPGISSRQRMASNERSS